MQYLGNSLLYAQISHRPPELSVLWIMVVPRHHGSHPRSYETVGNIIPEGAVSAPLFTQQQSSVGNASTVNAMQRLCYLLGIRILAVIFAPLN